MNNRERSLQLVGWVLFLVCATLFIISAASSGDMPYLVGSIIFFLACVLFVIPLLSRERPRSDCDEDGSAGRNQH